MVEQFPFVDLMVLSRRRMIPKLAKSELKTDVFIFVRVVVPNGRFDTVFRLNGVRYSFAVGFVVQFHLFVCSMPFIDLIIIVFANCFMHSTVTSASCLWFLCSAFMRNLTQKIVNLLTFSEIVRFLLYRRMDGKQNWIKFSLNSAQTHETKAADDMSLLRPNNETMKNYAREITMTTTWFS